MYPDQAALIHETLAQCERTLGAPIELPPETAATFKRWLNQVALPPRPDTTVLERIEKLNPDQVLPNDYAASRLYGARLTKVGNLADKLEELGTFPVETGQRLRDYALNIIKQIMEPATKRMVFYGEELITVSGTVEWLLKLHLLDSAHLEDIVRSGLQVNAANTYERGCQFSAIAAVLETAVKDGPKELKLSAATAYKLLQLLEDGALGILYNQAHPHQGRPNHYSDQNLEDMAATYEIIVRSGVQPGPEHIAKLTRALEEIFRAEQIFLKLDIQHLKEERPPANQSAIGDCVTAMLPVTQQFGLTLDRDAFGQLGEWFKWNVQFGYLLFLKHLKAAMDLGVPLNSAQISTTYNQALRANEEGGATTGSMRLTLVQMAPDLMKSGIPVDRELLKTATLAGVAAGGCIVPEDLKYFAREQVLSAADLAGALKNSSDASHAALAAVIDLNPILALELVIKNRIELNLFSLRQLLEKLPSGIGSADLTEICQAAFAQEADFLE